jgi:hypothetical protein
MRPLIKEEKMKAILLTALALLASLMTGCVDADGDPEVVIDEVPDAEVEIDAEVEGD